MRVSFRREKIVPDISYLWINRNPDPETGFIFAPSFDIFANCIPIPRNEHEHEPQLHLIFYYRVIGKAKTRFAHPNSRSRYISLG